MLKKKKIHPEIGPELGNLIGGLTAGAGAQIIGQALQSALDKGYSGIEIRFIKDLGAEDNGPEHIS